MIELASSDFRLEPDVLCVTVNRGLFFFFLFLFFSFFGYGDGIGYPYDYQLDAFYTRLSRLGRELFVPLGIRHD